MSVPGVVRDHSPELSRQQYSEFDPHEPGLFIVAGLSRAYGILPTADDGKVVWDVRSATRPLPLTSPPRPELAATTPANS